MTHGAVVHPLERATELAARFRELVETGPDELWASFGLGFADGRPGGDGDGHAQRPVRGGGARARRAARIRAAVADSIEAKPHLEPQTMNDEAQAWGQRFSMKSAFLRRCPTSSSSSASSTSSARRTEATRFLRVGVRRAIARPDEATAFTGREGAFWIAAETLWHDRRSTTRCRVWVARGDGRVQPYATEGRYVNDVAETGRASPAPSTARRSTSGSSR